MPPGQRNRTPSSTASDESLPLAKRRRVDVVVGPRNDQDKRNDHSPSMDSSYTAGFEQKVADFDNQQKTAPANGAIAMLDAKAKLRHSLMEPFYNIVTIECGDGLKAQYKVDLALLCAQSNKQFEIFTQADALYSQYVEAKALKERAKEFHFLLAVHQAVQVDNSRPKALDFIMESFEKFPILEYQSIIGRRIIEVVDVLFQKNDLLRISLAKGKKLNRSNYPKEDVLTRLEILNNEALFTVVERIKFSMLVIKRGEKNTVLEDPIKAAAYRRVLLPNADAEVVFIIVNWLSNQDLSFADAKQLLLVHEVSNHLGITDLTAQCMNILCSAVNRIIEQSKTAGMALKDVLNRRIHTDEVGTPLDPLSTMDVVGEVFHYTLSSENPPAALRTLVVNAIVEFGDEELLIALMENMTSGMKGEVAVATMRKAKRNGMAMRKTDPHQGQHQLTNVSSVPSNLEPQASSATCTDESIKSESLGMKDEWNTTNSEEEHDLV